MKRSLIVVGALMALSALAVWAATGNPDERPTYVKLTADLMVNDVNQTLDFYEQVLGFETALVVPEDNQKEVLAQRPSNRALVFALIKGGPVELMLQSRKSMTQELSAVKDAAPYASAAFYIEVTDVDRLCRRVQGKATILAGPMNKPYGKRELTLRDINGYILIFASNVEK
jgi:uncharacterized glyoxalase superfamily protein PhnB